MQPLPIQDFLSSSAVSRQSRSSTSSSNWRTPMRLFLGGADPAQVPGRTLNLLCWSVLALGKDIRQLPSVFNLHTFGSILLANNGRTVKQ
eukprot:7452977-Pyramimonas_sp.AAC.1